MQLVFSPTLCPDLLLPEVLDLAKAAGFSRVELFRAYTESTPVHRDWSVPMVRTAIADAGLANLPASTSATSLAPRPTPTSATSPTTCDSSNGIFTWAAPLASKP